MNKTALNTLFKLSKEELLTLSYDFVKLNRDFTNEQIPDFLLHFWAMPNYSEDTESNDIALLIFRYIIDLDSESKEPMERKITPGTYRFSQLFHIFQLVLSTTMYGRKYQLPIEAFHLFRIEDYNVPQLENPHQLLKEYLRVIKPIDSKKKAAKKSYQFEISIASKLSSLVFIEYFIKKIISRYYLRHPLSERVSKSIMATVNHAILFVNADNEEKYISLLASKNTKEFKVTVLCSDKNEEAKRCKFNPQMPTYSDDLKGWYLYSMKNIPDKISFLDNGAEVTLIFSN